MIYWPDFCDLLHFLGATFDGFAVLSGNCYTSEIRWNISHRKMEKKPLFINSTWCVKRANTDKCAEL